MTDRDRRLPAVPPRMTRRGFWRRFGRLEHERLEFKRSAEALQESIVAMAMARGGTIVLGVTDERELAGCEVDQRTLDRIALVAHETQVDVLVRPVRVGWTTLTLVGVPAVGDRVVTTSDGRILRRRGSANQPLRGDAVARFVRERDASGPRCRPAWGPRAAPSSPSAPSPSP
jgi:predicted HTH transcriptional regulator